MQIQVSCKAPPPTTEKDVFESALPHVKSFKCVCVCVRSFLCRVVAVDEQNRVAVFSLPSDAEIQLTADRATFFLVRVTLASHDRSPDQLDPNACCTCFSTKCTWCPDSSSAWST